MGFKGCRSRVVLAVLIGVAIPAAGTEVPFTAHTVVTSFDGARCVRTADIDGDSDLAVVGASFSDDTNAWWESGGRRQKGGWTKRVVDDNFAGVMSALTIDLDRDGDIDVVGAAETADELIWWQNWGGQFRIEISDLAPTVVSDGEMAAVLEIEAVHNGLAGDHDEELTSFALLLESGDTSEWSAGVP